MPNPFHHIQIPGLVVHCTSELDTHLPLKKQQDELREDMYQAHLVVNGHPYCLDVGWYGRLRSLDGFVICVIGGSDWENRIHNLWAKTMEELCRILDFESQYLTALQQMETRTHLDVPELPPTVWAILSDTLLTPMPIHEPINIPQVESDCKDVDEELFKATALIDGKTFHFALDWHREFRLGGYFKVLLYTDATFKNPPEFVFRAFTVEELIPILLFCVDSLLHWQTQATAP